MKRVLFLCTGNSCRSQMAEAIVNARFADEWQAVSAGTKPAGFVHPKAKVHHSFPDPAKTDDMADFRKVRDDMLIEIPNLLTQIG